MMSPVKDKTRGCGYIYIYIHIYTYIYIYICMYIIYDPLEAVSEVAFPVVNALIGLTNLNLTNLN